MSKALVAPASTVSPPFPWVGLIALACAVFLSVTSEMLPTGLLPDIGRSLEVTSAQAGLLVTWFAFTVVATSAVLAHLTRRLSRHGLIITVMVVLAVSNVFTALAPTYPLVVASRVLGGAAHGLFWAVVGAYAGHLVPREQLGRAVSITMAGGTLAFIFGVPLATAAGHLVGWQRSFLALAVLMLVGAAMVWRFLPSVQRETGHEHRSTDAAGGAAAPRRDPSVGAVTLVCLIVGLVVVGHYTFYTYIVPFLQREVAVGTGAVAPLLFASGVAGALGLFLTGTVFARRIRAGLIIGVGACAAAVSAMGLFSGNPVLAVVAFIVWGLAFGLLPPLLQTRMLYAASPRIRDTASAFFTTAFNAGIGGGALIGSLLLGSIGLPPIPFVDAGILVVALALLVASDSIIRRRAARA